MGLDPKEGFHLPQFYSWGGREVIAIEGKAPVSLAAYDKRSTLPACTGMNMIKRTSLRLGLGLGRWLRGKNIYHSCRGPRFVMRRH